MKVVMGLDVSTHLGVAVGGITDVETHVLHYDPKEVRAFRWKCYADEIEALVRLSRPDLVVIEGYSYGSPQGMAFLGELGGVVRATLYANKCPTVEVAPSTLKKFVTGKGNSKKQEILMYVYKKWGREFRDDNEADAFGLCMVGHALLGQLDTTVVMKDAVVKVRSSNSFVLKSIQKPSKG